MNAIPGRPGSEGDFLEICQCVGGLILAGITDKSVLSAKTGSGQVTRSGRSLMKSRNNTGPRTDNCGTPGVTGREFDVLLSSIRHCCTLSNDLANPELLH